MKPDDPSGHRGEADGRPPRRPAPGEVDLAFVQVPVDEFAPLLQGGFLLTVRLGGSLADLLVGQFGVDPGYLAGRIGTLFLDGSPVDDLERTLVRDGAVLSLSAAMPGLAGAMLRRGGVLSPLRSAISHHEGGGPPPSGEGRVTVKLFNLVIAELGGHFLGGGIILPAALLAEFLGSRPPSFWSACRSLADGAPVEPRALVRALGDAADRPVRLTVRGRP